MHDFLEALNRNFAALPARLRSIRGVVWSLAIVLAVAMGGGLGRIEIDMTMESFFLPDDPVRRLHERFKEAFGSDEGVYIVYEARDGDVFSEQSIDAVRAVQEGLLDGVGPRGDKMVALERIVEVTTIVNASYLEVDGDTLVSRDFIEATPRTGAEREALRAQALAHHDYPGFYVSKDSRFGGIWIRTDLGFDVDEQDESFEAGFSEDPEALDGAGGESATSSNAEAATMLEYAEFARAIATITDQPEHAGALAFYAVGNPIIMGFFNDELVAEMDFLFSGALLIMMIVLALLFRSASGVVWPIAIVAFTSILTLGMLGWMDVKFSAMISVLVILILVVGIADSVHILSGYLHWRREGFEHAHALEHVYRKSGLACLLTSVTTALGMLALAFVPIPPIRSFGFAAALGVMVAFAFTILLLPLMIDLWPPIPNTEADTRSARTPWIQRALGWFGPIGTRRPISVIVAFASVGMVGAYGVSRVQVDTNMVDIIRPGLPIRAAHELVDRVMGGTQGMEIYLDFGAPDALKDPQVLNAIDRVQRLLEQGHASFVVRTDSLTDVVKDTYRSLNEGREEMYRIPQDPAVLSQTLLLFDLANPEDREQLALDDYSAARINVRMVNFGSSAYVAFFETASAQARAQFAPLEDDYPDLDVGITGNLPLLMQMSDYIGRAQLQSFVMVLIVVTVLLLIVFGSVRAGMVAMVPNVYPVLMTFGVMGLFEIPLDADTLIIAPLIIGIAVDDTIHFVTHYRAFTLETDDLVGAIAATIREVGQAITFTSVILVLGFLILVTSNHQGMAHFGLLIGVAMVSALLADLLLLPSLLMVGRVRFAR